MTRFDSIFLVAGHGKFGLSMIEIDRIENVIENVTQSNLAHRD